MGFIMTDEDLRAEVAQSCHIGCVAQVASGDLVAHPDQNSSDPAHAGAAYANEVHGAEVGWHRL
jgi:hypothetical protein